MEYERDPETGRVKQPPRRFQSSIPLSEPSRRSQVLIWVFIGVALCMVLLVFFLYYTSGFGLWFSR